MNNSKPELTPQQAIAWLADLKAKHGGTVHDQIADVVMDLMRQLESNVKPMNAVGERLEATE